MRGADLACRVLLRLRCRLPVDPAEILRRCPGVSLHPYREAGELTLRARGGAEASTVANPDDPGQLIVWYDDRSQPLRLRYTLAHELGHVLARHHMEKERPEEEKEAEADCFASQLLVPRAALWLWARENEALCREQIAAACHVTPACAARALRDRTLPAPALLRETAALLEEELPPLRPVAEGQRLSRHWLTENELRYWRNIVHEPD